MTRIDRLVPCLILFLAPALSTGQVRTVDLLAAKGMAINAAGPLLVQADPGRNRIVLVNTLTASLTLIDESGHRVVNVPLPGRVPEWLKGEALAIDPVDGTIALVGTRQVYLLRPGTARAEGIATDRQYEAVACDGASGDLFLAGRESRDLLWWQGSRRRFRRIPLGEREDTPSLLNQTPPPPIRKVFFDRERRRLVALDGFTRTLLTVDLASGRRHRRVLALPDGTRWHLAGWEAERGLLLVVVETADRRVLAAARLDTLDGVDRVVTLPPRTEAVGIGSAPGRDLLWIPYDNHPELQLVDFAAGTTTEIPLPAFGNDASAYDPATGTLYVSSWLYGEIEVIDVAARRFLRRLPSIGVLPHMFTMAWGGRSHRLYIPLGATAVNGSWGSALTALDPATGRMEKIRTGWAPLDFVCSPAGEISAFDTEGEEARIGRDGSATFHPLPALYPRQALAGGDGRIYLSYGPHQSYWPVVYIWAARDGVLSRQGDGPWDDRRLPRQCQTMVALPGGELYGTQNNWGEEKQFLCHLPDPVRQPNLAESRLELPDTVSREASQRLLAASADGRLLVVARLGETDADPGIVQLVDRTTGKVLARHPVGFAPADLLVTADVAWIACFGSDQVWRVPLDGTTPTAFATDRRPLRLAALAGKIYVLSHEGRSLAEAGGCSVPIPTAGRPDALAVWQGRLVVASHSPSALQLHGWDPASGRFEPLLDSPYPYGDTSFATANNSFFQQGQYADGIFAITRLEAAPDGRLVIADLLSGRIHWLEPR